jgi:pimeloyl-ACP methyl ester carboxylesterase
VTRYITEILRFEGLADLDLIQAPGLCVAGTLDTIVEPKTAAFIAGRIRDGEHAMIEGAGHYPYLTHEREFNPMVLEFLRAVDSGKPRGALVGKA